MAVFDEIDRTDLSPSGYSEPASSYLNRSARPEVARVRDLIEAWFNELPPAEKPLLTSRIRSRTNKEHIAAFFEIYLSTMLNRLGYAVECHPLVRGTTKRPDFKASTTPRSYLFVEAVVALHESDRARGATARENAVFDAINTLHSPDFWLSLHVDGAPATPPPAGPLIRALSKWLATLHWEDLTQLYHSKDFKALPTYSFSHEGWDIVFTPIPKGEQARGRPGARPIGAKSGAFRVSRAKEAIRDAIARKATAYGHLTRPYVIAVNSYGVHTDREDVLEALFGTAQVLVYRDARKPVIQHAPDGVWRGPHGARNTRVSAVLVASSLQPWSVAARDPVLYINPWAKHRLTGPITRIPRVRVLRGRPTDTPGLPVRQLLDLPQGWPEFDAAA